MLLNHRLWVHASRFWSFGLARGFRMVDNDSTPMQQTSPMPNPNPSPKTLTIMPASDPYRIQYGLWSNGLRHLFYQHSPHPAGKNPKPSGPTACWLRVPASALLGKSCKFVNKNERAIDDFQHGGIVTPVGAWRDNSAFSGVRTDERIRVRLRV